MPVTNILYLDTPVTAEALSVNLVTHHGFIASEEWRTQDGTPWLIGERGNVLVQAYNQGEMGSPDEYPQRATIKVTLYPQRSEAFDTYMFLSRLAGDILQQCPGDAVLEPDTGGTTLLRRGDTVWVEPDPYTREHLFSGDFQPAKLVVGLPPPNPAQIVQFAS